MQKNNKLGKVIWQNSVKVKKYEMLQCAKFRGSRAIVGLVGLVPSYDRVKIFSRGCFVGPKLFCDG